MRTRMKTVAGLAASVAMAVGAGTAAFAAVGHTADPASERNAESKFTDAHRGATMVSQADAQRAAKQARPGRAFDAHLEDEGAGLRWEVKTDDGTHVWEVQMDSATGAVVSNQPEE